MTQTQMELFGREDRQAMKEIGFEVSAPTVVLHVTGRATPAGLVGVGCGLVHHPIDCGLDLGRAAAGTGKANMNDFLKSSRPSCRCSAPERSRAKSIGLTAGTWK